MSVDYQKIWRSGPQLLQILDTNRAILDVTDSYCEVLALTREELIGKDLFYNFPESPNSEQINLNIALEKVISDRVTVSVPTFRFDVINKETGEFETNFWRTISYPIVDDSSNIAYILHHTEKMTEQVQRSSSQDFTGSNYMIDTNGYVRTWNPGSRMLNQYDSSDILGKHFGIFYTNEDVEKGKPERDLETASKEGRTEFENWRVRKDGSKFWAHVILNAIRDETGQLLAFSQITRDLSERKENEENLIKAYEEYKKLKAQFLANMSHEIRTPMNGVMVAATMLKDTMLSEEQEELTTILIQSGNTLLKMINDILDYSTMEADRLALDETTFNIHEELSEITQNYRKMVSNAVKLELIIDEKVPIFMKGDRLRYHQVCGNLIDNAIKFTEKGHVRVELVSNVFDKDNNLFNISTTVTDTGIGISESDMQNLFQPFRQLDDFSTKRYQGTGIGLTICKRLIDLMHGQISAKSRMGEGSCFNFTVLMKPSETLEEPKVQEEIALPENHNMQILMVEDNIVNRTIALKILKKLGYLNIELAENGKIALEKCQDKTFDVILMDIQMPVMDGYTACREIRKLDANVPIIAVTANAVNGDKEKCLSMGMTDYISKPINIAKLSVAIKRSQFHYCRKS